MKKFLLFLILSCYLQAATYTGYVTDRGFGNNRVFVISTATNTTVGLPISVGTSPFGVVVAPDESFVYVVNSGINSVSVISTANNAVVATVSVGGSPNNLAITPDGNFVYVINSGDGTVSVISTATNTVVGGAIPVGTTPIDIAITPNGDFAYVTNNSSQNVSVISTATHSVVATVTLPAGKSPFGVAITPNGEFAYVTAGSSSQVFIISTATNTLVGSPIFVLNGPGYIAITPDGNFAYTSNRNASNTVSVISLATNTVVGAPIFVGAPPEELDITPDGNFVYVACSPDLPAGFISVISTATNTVVDTITFPLLPVPSEPFAIAFAHLSPPLIFQGVQKKNNFGAYSELYNKLTWNSSELTSIAGYILTRNGAVIATLGPSAVSYEDHNRIKSQADTYTLRAFHSNGSESFPSTITIGGH